MKKTKNRFHLLLIVGILLLSGCGKPGCMDRDGLNYDARATSDDGSCMYEGQVVLWYGENVAQKLVNDGANSLTFYVDNIIVGSSAANVYWTRRPDCESNGSITITKNLGNSKGRAHTYSVRDQTNHVYWNGILNFSANTCEAIELIW